MIGQNPPEPMMKISVVLLALIFISPAISQTTQQESEIVQQFNLLAEQEYERLRSSWESLVNEFLDESVGQPMLMSFPKKYRFTGITIESIPEIFDYDVSRTDSLIRPYQGHIEFPIIFLKKIVHAKGPRRACAHKPISTCLQGGGKMFESSILYKNSSQRMPETFRYYYVYEANKWKPRTTLREALRAYVLSLNLLHPTQALPAPRIEKHEKPPPTPPDV